MASILNPGILVLSAPSGGGKTSLARALVARRNDVEITVSHTTREQRPGEEHGVHYYFVGKTDFEAMIEKGDFIETARVFDNYYGTSIKAMEKLISRGKHAILDIDWQGARNVRRKYPEAISVFVMPPSKEALEQRLRERRQDSEEVIARRMRDAANEMSHKDEFDIIITNDDFENTADELEKILEQLGSTEHTEH
jgi:guanylate kinase